VLGFDVSPVREVIRSGANEMVEPLFDVEHLASRDFRPHQRSADR
jgi:hypothetical protein